MIDFFNGVAMAGSLAVGFFFFRLWNETRDRFFALFGLAFWALALTWVAHRARIFRVTGLCDRADWPRYREEFERVAASFRPLRPEDQGRITESRLRIRPARPGERIARVLARGGATWSAAQAAVANGIATERQVEPDWPVKVAVSERYRPTGRQGP